MVAMACGEDLPARSGAIQYRELAAWLLVDCTLGGMAALPAIHALCDPACPVLAVDLQDQQLIRQLATGTRSARLLISPAYPVSAAPGETGNLMPEGWEHLPVLVGASNQEVEWYQYNDSRFNGRLPVEHWQQKIPNLRQRRRWSVQQQKLADLIAEWEPDPLRQPANLLLLIESVDPLQVLDGAGPLLDHLSLLAVRHPEDGLEGGSASADGWQVWQGRSLKSLLAMLRRNRSMAVRKLRQESHLQRLQRENRRLHSLLLGLDTLESQPHQELARRLLQQAAAGEWQSLQRGVELWQRQAAGRCHDLDAFVQCLAHHVRSLGTGNSPAAPPQGEAAVELALVGLQQAFQSLVNSSALQVAGNEPAAHGMAQGYLRQLLAAATSAGIGLSEQDQGLIANQADALLSRMSSQSKLRESVSAGLIPEQLVVVLGMHRSGTSALAGLLYQAGLDGPKDEFLEASASNAKGFWESRKVVGINNRFLIRNHCRWNRLESMPLGWQDSDQASDWRNELLHCLSILFRGSRCPLIKDPRLSVLIPGLRPWLESGSLEIIHLLAIRHPAEVAASLHKRDNLSAVESVRLWLRHVLDAEKASRGWKRAHVHYGRILSDPNGTLRRCLQLTGKNNENEELNPRVSGFIDRKLRHCKQEDLIADFLEATESIRDERDIAIQIFELLTARDQITSAMESYLDTLTADWTLISKQA
jgi:hypothetical protein